MLIYNASTARTAQENNSTKARGYALGRTNIDSDKAFQVHKSNPKRARRLDLLDRSNVVVLVVVHGARVLDVRVLGDELVAVRARGEGRRVEVEEVDLLERQTLGLGDEEEREGEAQEAAAAPDEEHLGAEVGVAGTIVDEVGP